MARLDAALARHAEKWMKLSGPKLRDRVDLWVAKFDPAGVRVPPKVDDNRYVEIDAGQRGDGRRLRPTFTPPTGRRWMQRLEALAATVCQQRSAHQGAAPRRCLRAVGARRKPAWPASAAPRDCPAAAERARPPVRR